MYSICHIPLFYSSSFVRDRSNKKKNTDGNTLMLPSHRKLASPRDTLMNSCPLQNLSKFFLQIIDRFIYAVFQLVVRM